jgi:HPt (histidine-containing phosphotransfer) domain-containing protein
MDGVEATRILREEGYTLPILALTAGASHLEQASSLEAGMNDFLTKPVDFDELWGALTRWIPPKTQHKPGKEETAEDRFLDRPDILLKARQVFIDVHAQDAILLFQMMNDGEFEQMARVAHAIKGSSRTIGENDLAAVAAEIEQAAKLGNPDALMPLIHQLQLLFSQFQR